MPEQESPSKKKILTTDNLSTIKEINDYLYQTKLHSSDGSVVLTSDEDTTDIKVNKDGLVSQQQYREDQQNIWNDLDDAWNEIDIIAQNATVNVFNFYFDDSQSLNIVDILPDCIDNYQDNGYYWISINEGQPALWKLYHDNGYYYLNHPQQGCIVYMPNSNMQLNLSQYYGDYTNPDDFYSPWIELDNGTVKGDNFIQPQWTNRHFMAIEQGVAPKIWMYFDETDKSYIADVSVTNSEDDQPIIHCWIHNEDYQFLLERYTPPK